MLAFVDESGCMGMKLDRGSSRHFTVIAVLFPDRDVARLCDERIGALRRELRVTKEFHFVACSHQVRERFFREMCVFTFEYFGVVIDKKPLIAEGKTFMRPFLQAPVKSIFTAAERRLEGTTVVIDRTGSNEFRKMISRELKSAVNTQCQREAIKRVKSERSHSNNLLQLADMVCGAVARSFAEERADNEAFRGMIDHKELFIQLYP